MRSFSTYLISVYSAVLLLSSCETADKRIVKMATDPKSEYNQLDSTKGLVFRVRYLPPELLAYKESKEIGSREYAKYKLEFKYQLLFKVSFQWTNEQNFLEYDIQNENEYYQRLNYFLTDAGRDFRLISGKDTFPSVFCQIERTFKETPFVTMLVAFEKPKTINKMNVVYNAAIWSRPSLNVEFNKDIF